MRWGPAPAQPPIPESLYFKEVLMARFERHVEVNWEGTLMDGKGQAQAGTGAFTLPVNFPSRVEDPGGATSPEELIAAAHASCYAMALNATLGRRTRRHVARGSRRPSRPTKAKGGSRSCRRS